MSHLLTAIGGWRDPLLGFSTLSGSSLDLAIVDRIARMHDGQLQLLARAGGGLEARVELPIEKVR